MRRSSGCSKDGMNKGAWTDVEDKMLQNYVKIHGERKWSKVAKETGLKRCGKSCRLRWMNYLRPDIKRGNISLDEEDLIIRLHKLLGNRWSLIAGRLPGRTDNEIKNYWNSSLSKKLVNEPTKSFDFEFNQNKKKKSDKELVIVSPPKQNIDHQNLGKMEESNNNIGANSQLSEEFPILSNVMFGDQENLLDFLLDDFDTEDFCKMLGSDFENVSDVDLMNCDFHDSIEDNGVQVSDDQEIRENQ